jgi:hypothetical protein
MQQRNFSSVYSLWLKSLAIVSRRLSFPRSSSEIDGEVHEVEGHEVDEVQEGHEGHEGQEVFECLFVYACEARQEGHEGHENQEETITRDGSDGWKLKFFFDFRGYLGPGSSMRARLRRRPGLGAWPSAGESGPILILALQKARSLSPTGFFVY